MVGYAEALALALGVNQIAKIGTGRLRPDFQDRVKFAACTQAEATGAEALADIDCSEYDGLPPPAHGVEDLLDDGRKSFFSGHAAFAFTSATYWSLVAGGSYVWGKRARSWTIPLGILAQVTMNGAAIYAAASRIEDGRHHMSDVLVGSLVGIGIANLAYWRHFNTSGNPREDWKIGDTTVELTPGPGDAGLALSGRF